VVHTHTFAMQNTGVAMTKLTPIRARVAAVALAACGYLLYLWILGLIVSSANPTLTNLRASAAFTDLEVYGPPVAFALGLFYLLRYAAVKAWLRFVLTMAYFLGFFLLFEL